MAEWFEDESFWIELYPFMFRDERFQRAEEQVDKLLALTGFRGGTVLDLCCGPGRHSVALARRGFTVTAVDRTPFLLDKAKQRAREASVAIELVLEDMRRFVRPGAFDLALSFFTSFGYFERREEDLEVLRNLCASLKPGGVLVMDMGGKEWMARVFQATSSEVLPDGAMLIERREIIDDWSRIRNEWVLIRDGRARSFRFDLNLYSGQELKDRLLLAGFSRVRLHGTLEGAPYGPEAARLIAIAQKT